jgi:hypothetical protein
MSFAWLSAIISLNSINQLIFVMVKYGVLFEVRTGFLNIIYTSFGFKGGARARRFITALQQPAISPNPEPAEPTQRPPSQSP